MSEEWRPVADPPYGQVYSVSSLGRIRRDATGLIRKPCYTHAKGFRSDYEYTLLSFEGKAKAYRVATLIAAAFLGPKPKGTEINHIDGNRHNNAAANLEYVTHRQNEDHAKLHGLHPRGSRHHAAKVTEAQVLEIRKAHGTCEEIGRRYGIGDTAVQNIKARKTWKHVA